MRYSNKIFPRAIFCHLKKAVQGLPGWARGFKKKKKKASSGSEVYWKRPLERGLASVLLWCWTFGFILDLLLKEWNTYINIYKCSWPLKKNAKKNYYYNPSWINFYVWYELRVKLRISPYTQKLIQKGITGLM